MLLQALEAERFKGDARIPRVGVRVQVAMVVGGVGTYATWASIATSAKASTVIQSTRTRGRHADGPALALRFCAPSRRLRPWHHFGWLGLLELLLFCAVVVLAAMARPRIRRGVAEVSQRTLPAKG